MQHHFGQIFRKVELILFTFLSIIFLVTSKVNENFTRNFSYLFVDISLPIIKVTSFPFNTAISLLTNFQELVNAKHENKKLKEENDRLRSFYIKAINISNENEELKDILRFVIPRSTNYEVAKVTGRTHGLFNQKLFLNKGSADGIKEGSVVTGSLGLIGRVVDIKENKSRLMLPTDSNSRIPVLASKARARGVLVGNNSSRMEILYLSKHHQIKVGDMIFTSGDGDVLPPGLLIGVVTKVDRFYVAVEMAEDISNADIVTVMQY